jgi:hypothetical protein
MITTVIPLRKWHSPANYHGHGNFIDEVDSNLPYIKGKSSVREL